MFVGQGSGWEDLAARARGVAGVRLLPAVSADEADRWMARATATLASLRPGGYDYAYPTKILASLAQGTPVIYAGPGQAARDVHEGGLGVACALDPSQVAEAMVAFASDSVHWVGAEQARAGCVRIVPSTRPRGRRLRRCGRPSEVGFLADWGAVVRAACFNGEARALPRVPLSSLDERDPAQASFQCPLHEGVAARRPCLITSKSMDAVRVSPSVHHFSHLQLQHK